MVLSRTDRRAEIGHDDVERTVGIDISHTLPSDYRLALQAMNKGRPIVLDTQHELARAVVAFARGLAGVKATDKPHPPRIGSLFGRLAAGNA
jgi:pilus assembly protein CpaE